MLKITAVVQQLVLKDDFCSLEKEVQNAHVNQGIGR